MDDFKDVQKKGPEEEGRDQTSNKLIEEVAANPQQNAASRASALDYDEASHGVIPPYMLEELVKNDPSVKDHERTLMHIENQVWWWPFPWPKPSTPPHSEREVYDAKSKTSLPGTKARFEGDKATGDPEVDNAYDYTGQVRSFYKDVLGRNSIDNKEMKFVSTVNYGNNYENAFWNGKQMTYGKPGPNSPFKTFVLLDVCGHEITHGVTEKESGMRYYGQSGALNESLSDVFGEVIQQRANNTAAKDADWVVGDGIWKDTVKGRGLRDMLNPGTAYDDPKIGKDPQPDHMSKYKKMSGDNGGVHYNSGIPNRAFATFAIDVGGNAWEGPAKIWYAARAAAGNNPSFASFAHHTIDQAKKLGYDAATVAKLEKAWDGVGVKPDVNGKDTDTPIKPRISRPAPPPDPYAEDDKPADKPVAPPAEQTEQKKKNAA